LNRYWHHLSDSLWVTNKSLSNHIPESIAEEVSFKKGYYKSLKRDSMYYMIEVKDRLKPGEEAPRTVVQKQIEKLILHKRTAFAQSQAQSAEFGRCEIIEAIIGQKLIVHQAKLDSIIVTDAEVDAQIDFRISSVLRQMGGDEERFEEYYQMTVDEMSANLREDMISQLLAERMQQQILTEVEITPKEVQAFFNVIPKDSLPFLSAEVEVAEIVAAPQVNEIGASRNRIWFSLDSNDRKTWEQN